MNSIHIFRYWFAIADRRRHLQVNRLNPQRNVQIYSYWNGLEEVEVYETATLMMRWEAQHCNNLLRNKCDKVEAIKMKWRACDNWCSSTLILSALRALLDQCNATRWTHTFILIINACIKTLSFLLPLSFLFILSISLPRVCNWKKNKQFILVKSSSIPSWNWSVHYLCDVLERRATNRMTSADSIHSASLRSV